MEGRDTVVGRDPKGIGLSRTRGSVSCRGVETKEPTGVDSSGTRVAVLLVGSQVGWLRPQRPVSRHDLSL